MLSFKDDASPNYSEDEKNILQHEYSLRQFIHIATRYAVKAIYESRTEESPFTFYYEHFIANARTFFEAFKNSLRKELSNYTPDKWAAYGIDIKERFMPMMELYKKWYNDHKAETEKFGEYNPYELMYENILSTGKEILKYFPEKIETEKQGLQQPMQSKSEKDIFKEIVDRWKLHDFLSVPDAELLTGYYWHDVNDNPIDCNIYHPNYGYPGFKTYNQDIVAAGFGTRYSYTDYETRETIYAPYHLQMLCVDEEGNFINKDGKKVVKVPYTDTLRKRLAENDADFETILQREFQAKELSNNPQTKTVFTAEIQTHVQELIELHKAKSSYEQKDFNLLGLANSFLNYLKRPSVATHRELILAHIYKVKAGVETEKNAIDWKEERGEKAKQAFYTLMKQSKNYKEPRQAEIRNVVELLKEYPTAQMMAVNDLKAL